MGKDLNFCGGVQCCWSGIPGLKNYRMSENPSHLNMESGTFSWKSCIETKRKDTRFKLSILISLFDKERCGGEGDTEV